MVVVAVVVMIVVSGRWAGWLVGSPRLSVALMVGVRSSGGALGGVLTPLQGLLLYVDQKRAGLHTA
ncbi:hypothetical protein F5X96DRAFT_615197 [Biscogniauxia mediterranea]|nr:hypothetical protein F5X96DRAFT_615197 [Biscogniauxia mediterranea]